MKSIDEFWNEEEGMGTVEMVLIIAALVAVALLFRNAIVSFITDALGKVFGSDTQEGLKVKGEQGN